MKYFLVTTGSLLVILLLAFLFQNPVQSESRMIVPTSDEVIKTTEKSENIVNCTHAQEVYHIKHVWVVSEYKSGKIVTDERRDTLRVETLQKGQPCPGDIVEVTMR